jgi:hypothetical protein
MAEADISAQEPLGNKSIALAPSAFEVWAQANGYNVDPALSPCPLRQYADRETQKAFEAYQAGVANTARIITESMLETEALRGKLLAIAVSE